MDSRIVEMLGLIRDEAFSQLWRDSCDKAMTWEMFCSSKPPRGYSINDTYAIITALRRRISIPLPFDNYIPNVTEPYNWFLITETMHEHLTQLVAQSQTDSCLESYLNDYVFGQSKMMLLLDEYLSVTRRDGLVLRSEDVRSIWNHTREPKTPEEQLSHNFSQIISKIDRYKDRRISYGMIEEINAELTHGVDFYPSLPHSHSRITQRKASVFDDPETALTIVADIAEGRGTSAEIHPIFRSMLISGVFWEFFPLPSVSATTELIIRMIFYNKEELPVLGWVSFSRISEQWEQGLLSSSEILCSYLESFPDCGEGFDATTHFATELQIMLRELEWLQCKLNSLFHDDEKFRAILEHERFLNPRQREILLFSLRNPGCQHTISQHQKSYDVVYATARQDLVDLVDMGYLSQYKRGRAFVFEATPRFYEYIKSRAIKE